MQQVFRINRGDASFTAKDVAELKLMAVSGRIHPTDLVQPPGRSDWLYAQELTDLAGIKLKQSADEEARALRPSASGGKALRSITAVLTIGTFGFGGWLLYYLYQTRPAESPPSVFGETGDALSPTDGLATEYANILASPDGKANKVGEMKKDSKVKLVARMGDFYEIETADGQKGWVGVKQVAPCYLLKREWADEYDSFYNPDKYLMISNSSWSPRGDPKKPETLTDMMFTLENPTQWGMENVSLHVTFRDPQDQPLGEMDLVIPRLLPPKEALFVSNVEVDIEWEKDPTAKVVIHGARGLWPDDFSRKKADEEVRLRAEAEALAKTLKPGEEPTGMQVSAASDRQISMP